MNPDEDQPTPDWLDQLDALLAGRGSPADQDDELLHLARRLHTALAPLRTLNQAEEDRRLRLLRRLHTRQPQILRMPRLPLRATLLVGLLLLVVLVSGTSYDPSAVGSFQVGS